MGKKSLSKQIFDLTERAFRNGHELAFLDVIVFCHESKRPLPAWALDELARRSHLQAHGKYKPKKKRGPHGSLQRQQQDFVTDARRFQAVRDLCDEGMKWQDAVEKVSLTKPLRGYETIRKSYFHHKKRLDRGTHYISLIYLQPDVVAYVIYNRELSD